MRATDLITKKKENIELTTEEINWIIKEYTIGNIPDYQMSAFLMAIYFNGLSDRETIDMTLAMRDSGDVLDLSKIEGIKVDKHSSGGVGDKVSLVLVGIIASLDVPFAKMSGRGLGHTGGTIDKLESIPGFNCNLTEDEFVSNVNSIGVALAGQTKDLAPADKKIYALRDTTSTVDEISLIASSIMSKKLSSGCDGVVLDVTVGSGAFMTCLEDARALSEKMVTIGNNSGMNTVAVLTNMDEPLGHFVGNALEVYEALLALKGNGPDDLMNVVKELACEMLIMAKRVSTKDEAISIINDSIESGSAYKKFLEFVEHQGGNKELLTDLENFRNYYKIKFVKEVYLNKSGYIKGINALKIGHASLVLGGGRENLDDIIDFGVGIELSKKVGDYVKESEPVAIIYGNDENKIAEAYTDILDAYVISDDSVPKLTMILDIIK